jgi:hypothetical protein
MGSGSVDWIKYKQYSRKGTNATANKNERKKKRMWEAGVC